VNERTSGRPLEESGEILTDGRIRVVIERVKPEVDAGRFPIKRVVGETVEVEADIFTDGHDAVRGIVCYRHDRETTWREVEMKGLANDRFHGKFEVQELGRYRYTVLAWVDHFLSWRNELARRVDTADIAIAARVGAELVAHAAARAQGAEGDLLQGWSRRLREERDAHALKHIGLDEELWLLMARHSDRSLANSYANELEVVVDRPLARFSAWYEFFPRSCATKPGAHGTFRDSEARLDYAAQLGFDVVYLPPIHPIGRVERKGPNNSLTARPSDPGSPWAIGSAQGGHKAVHPELGTLDDFRWFVAQASERGLEVALDIAYQCAPDHPYVTEHPEWFRWRPDNTVQYAENPPKKYQDIYPFNFESEHWEELWRELESVLELWIAEGIRIFRVDNPHTKPFSFWEWAIAEVKRKYPDVIFLAEAFTRPKVMHRLAKLGFTQSYTYFAWRNSKHEIVDYFTELTRGPGREYFRPNCWPNTPDILTEYLQFGGRPAFMTRLVLAATLSASYGIYGPAFELMESDPREPGSEEYLDSEKYQIRQWDLDQPGSLRHFVARLNRIRRENAALQSDWTLAFHSTDNDSLLCYSKSGGAGDDSLMLMVANLDPHHVQSGWVDLPLGALGLDAGQAFQAHDLLSGARFLWRGARNYVSLDPQTAPAHIFRLRRRVRSERDFDYFL
jgi:starch synthase (maltosyl-transferring)